MEDMCKVQSADSVIRRKKNFQEKGRVKKFGRNGGHAGEAESTRERKNEQERRGERKVYMKYEGR